MTRTQLEREATRLINKSSIRTARRLLSKVMDGCEFWNSDPITRACGENIGTEFRTPDWFWHELRRLGLTIGDLALELDYIARVEGQHTPDGAPPTAYYEMSFICVELV